MLLSAPTLTALMLWASQLSGLPADTSRLPSVEYSYDIPDTVGAWTFIDTGQIQVNANIKWTPEQFTCTIVHELVHELQFQAHYPHGTSVPAVEPPAYETMAKCFAAFGQQGAYHWAMRQADENNK